MKPMLATDYDAKRLSLPVCMQPKVDGVRSVNLDGTLTGRSLKQHKNMHVTDTYSDPLFKGLDGEMFVHTTAGAVHPRLCSLTTSALNTIAGYPLMQWWVFDYVTEHTLHLPYVERYHRLALRIKEIRNSLHNAAHTIVLMPSYLVSTPQELEEHDQRFCAEGYEGSIVRDPHGAYKQGRSTVREGGLLRIKHFVEEEALVLGIEEGQHNGNEAKTNELGFTERSTHQAGMVPNGMVGALVCRDLKTGKTITVAAGSMTHEERRRYFANQAELVGKTIKYKTFLKGVKDLPRFPTFQSIRSESDM